MNPYSLDLRRRILDAYARHEGSVRDLAERFEVSPTTVENYLRRQRETGDVLPVPHRGTTPRLLSPADERVLRALVAEQNDRTDAEYARLFKARTGQRVSRRTINRTWKRMGYTRKKKVLHASERDRPDVERARRAFRRRAQRHRSQRHIFLDEFGLNLGMTRRYARAPRGRRAVGAVPTNPDPNLTLILGLTRRGLLAPFEIEGGLDGASYETYVRTQLAPKLRRGDIVHADGVGAHRSVAAGALIRARGATYELLPPYSPDLTPVEEAGAKVKAQVRGANARTRDALDRAIAAAIQSITARDARGWFSDRARYLEPRATRRRPTL